VDADLKPGKYALQVSISAQQDPSPIEVGYERQVQIMPRPILRMPVLMWGGGDVETLTDIGFTHKLIWLHDYRRIWDASAPTDAVEPVAYGKSVEMLDELLAHGLGGAVYLYPGRWVMRDDELAVTYGRIGREGLTRGTEGAAIDRDNVCANFPAVSDFAYNVGASVAQSFGDHPGLQASLVHSEIRDATQLCFHEHDVAAYRAATGAMIPAEAAGKSGVRYGSMRGFPVDRVVADDDPILSYYRWFWREGDGWNGLHTRVSEGLKSTGRDDLWTFFDPAVRAPSLWGSGGGVDIVSQWTYSHPDPIKIGQAADELFAMAEGRKGQQVMKMTQVIWYRSQTAPELPDDEADYADWEREIPDARFITTSPDHMREAFWAKISRPIRGIMYHGWGSLVEGVEHGAYRYTNPATREVLKELTGNVVKPLGPTLLQVPDRPARIGVLESFTSQMFASRGTHGWGVSWEADAHLVLQWAQLQPQILFEEQILRDGLADLDVLVMPACDVLTESVATAIAAFQTRGGILVADENLAPRLTPDILIESYRRTGRPDEDKAVLQAKAAQLRRELDPYVERYGESDNPDVVVRFRQSGNNDYLFVINDHRAFGDYVGHHGRVMEVGLPSSAAVTVRRAAGTVYDLVDHREVPTRSIDGGLVFDTDLGPGDGAVYLITDAPIADVDIEAPASVTRGQEAHLAVTIRSIDGVPVGAVVPVEVEIADASGVRAEYSGYYGAADGALSIDLSLATNDEPGDWIITVRELASGKVASKVMTVLP
ncbi:MAG: hypothetical protein HOH74_07370, partial [Gemmatimonadetes bacterium]|nr:hypothetical protein [Gemmatimonadota bacterium]